MIRSSLAAEGWCTTGPLLCSPVEAISDQIENLARQLGNIVPGRTRQLIEQIVPQAMDTAQAATLSSVYGLNQLPLHTDAAHWPVPCRFLVIGCVEPGPVPVPTMLLDFRRVRLSKEEVSLCRRTPFLIRNGQRSFYGSILDEAREFIRIDPGCMTAVSKHGNMVLNTFNAEKHEDVLHSHSWSRGDILIIDNWRVMHGRGGSRTAPGRKLLRAMVR